MKTKLIVYSVATSERLDTWSRADSTASRGRAFLSTASCQYDATSRCERRPQQLIGISHADPHAQDIAEAIVKLNFPKLHLVGLGFKTVTCYQLVLRHSELFKSATFLSPATLNEVRGNAVTRSHQLTDYAGC